RRSGPARRAPQPAPRSYRAARAGRSLGRDAGRAVERAGELAVHRARGVRVIAGVDCGEAARAEVAGAVERPGRGLERLHDVSRPLDLRRLARLERAVCDLVDGRRKQVRVAVAGHGGVSLAEELLIARAAERAD